MDLSLSCCVISSSVSGAFFLSELNLCAIANNCLIVGQPNIGTDIIEQHALTTTLVLEDDRLFGVDYYEAVS